MNYYEEKQAEKKERYARLASQLKQKAETLYKTGTSALEMIPFGQPILVGHHSERADRAYRGRAVGKIEKSFEVGEKAEYYARKAEGTGSGISSDDPEAITKLEAKLAQQVIAHEAMKKMNSEARKNGTEKPCAAYMFSNSNGRMKATRERIQQLKAKQSMGAREEIVGNGFTVKESVEENRIMFVFEGKPEESVMSVLKSHGFKWSPTRTAWVRQLSASGRYATEQIINKLKI